MQKQVSIKGGSPNARLKLLGYYAQRIITSRTLRKFANYGLVAGLRTLHGPALAAQTPDLDVLDAMRRRGLLDMGRLLSAQQCAEMLDWLRDKEMTPGRSSGPPFRIDGRPAYTRVGDHSLETLVNCPHVMDLANHPRVLGVATCYLGYTPVISLMALRWTFPGESRDDSMLAFHRDSEPGSIKLLVYLTDVDLDAGPHSYLPGSHRERMPLRLRHYRDDEVRGRHGVPLEVTGPAGTAFFIDTKGIHRGAPPRRSARLLLSIQYSLLPCLLYDYAPVAYRGQERFSPYVNRLMVAADLIAPA